MRSGRGMAGREGPLRRRPYDSFGCRDILWYVLRQVETGLGDKGKKKWEKDEMVI